MYEITLCAKSQEQSPQEHPGIGVWGVVWKKIKLKRKKIMKNWAMEIFIMFSRKNVLLEKMFAFCQISTWWWCDNSPYTIIRSHFNVSFVVHTSVNTQSFPSFNTYPCTCLLLTHLFWVYSTTILFQKWLIWFRNFMLNIHFSLTKYVWNLFFMSYSDFSVWKTRLKSVFLENHSYFLSHCKWNSRTRILCCIPT